MASGLTAGEHHPLKQGLRRGHDTSYPSSSNLAGEHHPLKQGLRHGRRK